MALLPPDIALIILTGVFNAMREQRSYLGYLSSTGLTYDDYHKVRVWIDRGGMPWEDVLGESYSARPPKEALRHVMKRIDYEN